MFEPLDQAMAVSRRLGVLILSLAALAACGPSQPAQEGAIPIGLATRFYPPQGWTWGRVGVESGPSLRYGVTSPTTAPKAQILILPDQGEPAEVWFETAHALLARRYGVWIVDWSGLGAPAGGLWAPARGHGVPAAAAPAIQAMATQVVRAEQPLVLLASGTGVEPALRALALGLPVDAVILSSPRKADSARQISRDPGRRRVAELWGRADPALRPDDRLNPHDLAARWRKPPAQPALERITAPVTILASGLEESCAGLPRCRLVRLGRAREPLHIEADRLREAWWAEVRQVIDASTAGRTVAAPPTSAGKTP